MRMRFDIDFTVDEDRKLYGAGGAGRTRRIRRLAINGAVLGIACAILLAGFALSFDLPRIARETRAGASPSPTLMTSFICATAGLLALAGAGRCALGIHRLRRGMVELTRGEHLCITKDGYLLFGCHELFTRDGATGRLAASPHPSRVVLRMAYLPWCSFHHDAETGIVLLRARTAGAIGIEVLESSEAFRATEYGARLVRDADPHDFARRYRASGAETLALLVCFDPPVDEALARIGVPEEP